MLHEAVLNLAGPDAIAATLDHVVVSAEIPEVSLLVLMRRIAGQQEIVSKSSFSAFRIPPVLEEHHRIGPSNGDVSRLATWHLLTIVVDDSDVVARRSPPHRSWQCGEERRI